MTIMTQMTIFLTPALSPKYRHNRHYRHGETEGKSKYTFCLQNREMKSNRAGLGCAKPQQDGLAKMSFCLTSRILL